MRKCVISIAMIIALLCMTACGGNTSATVDMQQVYDDFDSYLPEMVVLDDSGMMNLYGIDSEKCTQAIVTNCNDGLRSDEIWLIEAVDETSAQEIAELAQNRIEREKEETKNYAPDQYAVVEKAQILEDGNNVVLIISPDVDTLVEIYNSAAKA